MQSDDAWSQIAKSPFVSLTTHRKNGESVATPVWIASEGEELVVTTERETGKVKRLRRNPSVTMRPCGRMGQVAPDAVTVNATARFDDDQTAANAALAAKYGLQFTVILGLERLIRRVQRKPGQRVIIRITNATTSRGEARKPIAEPALGPETMPHDLQCRATRINMYPRATELSTQKAPKAM